MARLRDIVIDCSRPSAVARFWAAALDGYAVAPYDASELERLAQVGISDPEEDPTVLVDGPPGRPRLWFQAVPEPRTVKNRVHLDLEADDVDLELRRLESLGATRAEDQPNPTLVVLQDPEGNEFCLFR